MRKIDLSVKESLSYRLTSIQPMEIDKFSKRRISGHRCSKSYVSVLFIACHMVNNSMER